MNEKLVAFTEEILTTLQKVYVECTDHSSEGQILSAIVAVKQMQLNLFSMLHQTVDDYDPLDYCSPV
jgi:hypothetical protein